MKTIGELVVAAKAPAVQDGSDEPRLHRVTMCYMVFAELEVFATSALEARVMAETQGRPARRKFRTQPFVSKIQIKGPKHPETGEVTWIEVDPSGRKT